MGDFFSTMSGLERGYTLCMIVGGTLLILRILMMLLGGDADAHADFDSDMPGDDIGDTDADFRLVSVQGVLAFLAIFGATGRAFLLDSPLGNFGSLVAAFICGVIAMAAMGWSFMLMKRLQDSGNVNLRDAIGNEGTVYLNIPEGGAGEVQIVFAGKMQIHEATSESKEAIATGTPVIVVDVVGGRTMIVKPKDSQQHV